MNDRAWQLWIDTGGTFTDCIAFDPGGHRKRVKVLSSSALRGEIKEKLQGNRYLIDQEWNAPNNFITGFRFRLLQDNVEAEVTGFDAMQSTLTLNRELILDDTGPASFEVVTGEEAPVLAARLVTQTPAGEELPPIHMRLATTKGTNALLERKGKPTVLFVSKGYRDLLEIGTQQRPDLFSLNVEKPKQLYHSVIEVDGRIDAEGIELVPLNTDSCNDRVDKLIGQGIRSAAVAFMHSYQNPDHEQKIKEWLRKKGFTHISVSSDLIRFIRIIPRAETTLVNAYLAPLIDQYLESVDTANTAGKLFVMTSAGGLTPAGRYNPKDSLLSGPAGGVVGAATSGKLDGYERVISFDMGGTSTDVARYDGLYEYLFEHRVGEAHLVAPALSIETVAAGGGSVCIFDGHKLCVGPESAGAYPGPACYGAGGPLTITDVNLLLGRLDPKNFHIPVVPGEARLKLDYIIESIQEKTKKEVDRQSVLTGFLNIANERMADAIRKISIRKGYDTHEYALVAFGGAGAQHACAIAGQLNMDSVLIPDNAGLLSANGLGHAVLEEFAEKQILKPLESVEKSLDDTFKRLIQDALIKLRESVDAEPGNTEVRRKIVSMRFEGQENTLEIEYHRDKNLTELFKKTYTDRFGHWVTERKIEVESIRVIASTKSGLHAITADNESPGTPDILFRKKIWFDGGMVQAPVYDRTDFKTGHRIEGPALILDPHSTIVVEPGWNGSITSNQTIELKWEGGNRSQDTGSNPEEVMLELFTNRFSSIAGEMGEMLQRTALSVNVKDRLDFSCALFNTVGELVVNAPHIPVHLGALGLCVRRLMETIEMKPGDVVVTNHPDFGGAHLPDVTVVTPVFTDKRRLIGFAASRAHHAEIGGTYPGSMPPDATSLIEEGVVIPPMHLIRKGEGRWEEIRDHLLSARFPTRDIEENMADLRAAVAANHRGAGALRNLAVNHGLGTVKHYMQLLREHASSKMRDTLRHIPNGVYESEELLDDGTPLKVVLSVEDEAVKIDFTGTGDLHKGNLNATPAIVNSVVMYVLRLLIGEPLPLNEGIMEPVEMVLPACLLNPVFDDDPAKCPAVVGGNVEVSQRLVDTLLKPFERVACSQGTMNNVLFGNDSFGYYETVGGGTGAGPDFNGADAVHHHMTNTRGTDPEILEFRYPVRLDRYAVRQGSGGEGRHTGGSGIIREMTFLEPVRLTVLTQHRKEKPYGLCGGRPGKTGEQWVIYSDTNKEKLESTDGRGLEKGDRFILKTPGGGGFGKP